MTHLMPELVTFVFTDIEGSTTRWEHYPAAMQTALDQHHTLIRAAFAAHGGTVSQTAGDGFVSAFARPDAALAAALAAQRALQAAAWPAVIGPLRVRVALHSGPGEQRADGYHAEFTLNRLARLLAAGHGGQILVTATTRHQLDCTDPPVAWRDLGEHWLKDLIHPLHVYQAVVPDLPQEFPPLNTLSARPALTGAPSARAAAPPHLYSGLPAREETAAATGEPPARGRGEPAGRPQPRAPGAGLPPTLEPSGLLGADHWLFRDLLPGAELVEGWPLPAARMAAGGFAEQWRPGV
jgi:class 3 adenylate cyclase